MAIVLAALAGLTLPDLARPLDPDLQPTDEPMPPVVAGAFHVHTDRAGGSGTADEIAEAASRAGLSFVIVTDHGDGTRAPDPPRYHGDVLILDGVEISTTAGHYVAVGQRQAPYPLGGEPRDVVEDVARLDGFGVLAHPGSPKPMLRWQDWTVEADGLEWLNADSAWRDERWYRLGLSLLHYPIRAPETIASLFDRPVETLLRWDTLTQRRRVVALAGSDAHGAVALPFGTDVRVPPIAVPSYEQVFRTFAIRVQLDEIWTGDSTADAAALLEALREGRTYTAIDALATPGLFHFSARAGSIVAQAGGTLPVSDQTTVRVRAAMPRGAEIRLYENGGLAHWSQGPELRYEAVGRRGVFRAEVVVPATSGRSRVPWIVSNPIYVGMPAADILAARAAAGVRSVALFSDQADTAGWAVEHDTESVAAAESTQALDGRELALRYALSGGDESPFAALVRPEVGAFARLRFTVRGDRPQRISVQIRAGDRVRDLRWQRSVYVGTEPRAVSVRLQDMRPVQPRTTLPPQLDDGAALLFVVDSMNTPPATAGVVWLDDVRLEDASSSP